MKLTYRDDRHEYRVDGVRYKGVTTVAKILDDTYGLDQWRKRSVALGMALEPALVERASAHFDEKQTMNAIAEDAMRAARTHEKADRGTAIHKILERHDLGDDIIETALSRAMRAAWDRALKEAKITIDPDYIERILLFPQQKIAGRMDRFVKVGRSKSYACLDVKSGSIAYPHAIACQLAMYCNADLIAGQLDPSGATEKFTELPDMDRHWAYIVHTPDPEHVSIHKIDVRAGWDIVKKSIFPALEWRARKNLVEPVVTTELIDPLEKATDEQVASIKARLVKIQAAGDMAKRICAARWPNNVAKPKDFAEWSAADIERIEARLETVERDGEVSF